MRRRARSLQSKCHLDIVAAPQPGRGGTQDRASDSPGPGPVREGPRASSVEHTRHGGTVSHHLGERPLEHLGREGVLRLPAQGLVVRVDGAVEVAVQVPREAEGGVPRVAPLFFFVIVKV